MNATEYMKHWEGRKVWKRLSAPIHQNRFRAIASYLEGKTFVDIGCAFGHSTSIMKGMKDGEWMGVDFDYNAIGQATDLFPGITFRYLPDIQSIPLLGSFDSVVCSEVIEHIEDDQTLVDDLIAITGKALVITTPNYVVDDPGHLRVYTDKTFGALFKEYPSTEITQSSRFFYAVVRK